LAVILHSNEMLIKQELLNNNFKYERITKNKSVKDIGLFYKRIVLYENLIGL